MFAVCGILSALIAREHTGIGQELDISMLDCQIALLTYQTMYYFLSGLLPKPVGSGHTSIVPFQAFKAKDGYIVAIANNENFWIRLCKAMEIEQLAKDERFNSTSKRLANRIELETILEEIFKTKNADEWLSILRKADVPTAVVNTIDKALSEPSIIERNMIVEIDRFGDTLKIVGNPIKMSGFPVNKYFPPPSLGQHTQEILADTLNYSSEKINQLEKDGVIRLTD
jgi:CoA:oxalate CoA-transferase